MQFTRGERKRLSQAPGHQTHRPDWLRTEKGEPRGYIQTRRLTEVWFHTGTICNLRCPFCLEGSKPGDNRIEPLTLEDARPFIDEAVTMGVDQLCFTGGEPFVVREMIKILEYSLQRRPCLVLTNGTEPVFNRMDQLLPLRALPHPLKLRVSLDYPDPERHDGGRGRGNFQLALECLGQLHDNGFPVSIARQSDPDEDEAAVDRAFSPFLESVGVPREINIVSFPDFLPPGSTADVPEITEDCMTRHQTAETRAAFMCSYTRFVLKRGAKVRVYACTLVDDDPDYDLGGALEQALEPPVMLKHHRCFSCFKYGASCSER